MEEDTQEINRYQINERNSKVWVDNFGKAVLPEPRFLHWVHHLPDILAGKDLKELINAWINAKVRNRGCIIGMGGHVIKTGVSPYLIALIKEGFITAVAMNGAAMIHDFEICRWGKTSENVEHELGKGRFGFAQETGNLLNRLINQAVDRGLGIGKGVSQAMVSEEFPFKEYSVSAQAGIHGIPVTVHVALGTDIIHMHPECDGARTGLGTMRDFHSFVNNIKEIDDGGGYLNLGSAVILPEIFLKAISIARNQNPTFGRFFTANFDFITHYRPEQSVIRRPRLLGARSWSFRGHHEIMIPLIAQALLTQNE